MVVFLVTLHFLNKSSRFSWETTDDLPEGEWIRPFPGMEDGYVKKDVLPWKDEFGIIEAFEQTEVGKDLIQHLGPPQALTIEIETTMP